MANVDVLEILEVDSSVEEEDDAAAYSPPPPPPSRGGGDPEDAETPRTLLRRRRRRRLERAAAVASAALTGMAAATTVLPRRRARRPPPSEDTEIVVVDSSDSNDDDDTENDSRPLLHSPPRRRRSPADDASVAPFLIQEVEFVTEFGTHPFPPATLPSHVRRRRVHSQLQQQQQQQPPLLDFGQDDDDDLEEVTLVEVRDRGLTPAAPAGVRTTLRHAHLAQPQPQQQQQQQQHPKRRRIREAGASPRRSLKDPPPLPTASPRGEGVGVGGGSNETFATAAAVLTVDDLDENGFIVVDEDGATGRGLDEGFATAAGVVFTVDDSDDFPGFDGKSSNAQVLDRDSGSVQVLDDDFPGPAPLELQVLEVIPDVELNHVARLLEQLDGDPAQVVAHLLEQPNYPKSKTTGTAPAANSVPILRPGENNKKWTLDFASASSFEPSALYIKEARAHLRIRFPFVSHEGSKLLLRDKGSGHYAIAVDKMVRFLQNPTTATGETAATAATSSSDPNAAEAARLDRYESALRSKPFDPAVSQLLQQWLDPTLSKKVVTKVPHRIRGGRGVTAANDGSITNDILREEIEYANHKIDGWFWKASVLRFRERNKARAQQLGTGIECACCCDDFDIDDMVACRHEGHIFCASCLQRHASTKLYGEGNLGIDRHTKKPALDLLCFHPDGCDSPFDRPTLAKALDEVTLRKYDEVQTQLTVSLAGLTDLVECPKCHFQAALAPSVRVFVCPCGDCNYASCRECGEAAHVPLRCDEVEHEAETKGRLTVEEAISAAKIRQCPKCKKAFVKSDGCNKVRCGCGIYVCYLCRKQIAGYDHFCSTAHCQHDQCGKCRLHSNADFDDDLAMKEAGLRAADQVKAQAAAVTSKEISIDVDSILLNPDRPSAPQRPPQQPPQPRQQNWQMPQQQPPQQQPWQRRLIRDPPPLPPAVHAAVEAMHQQAQAMLQRAMEAQQALVPGRQGEQP